MSSIICLCVVCNEDYLLGLIALLNSLIKHTDGLDLPIYIVDLDLRQESKDRLLSIYHNLIFMKSNYRSEDMPKQSGRFQQAFHKLNAFDLALNYNRVLCIDADVIFTGSISELLVDMPKSIRMSQRRDGWFWGTIIDIPKISKELHNDIFNKLYSLDNTLLAEEELLNILHNDKTIQIQALEQKRICNHEFYMNNNKQIIHQKNKRIEIHTPSKHYPVGIHYAGDIKPWHKKRQNSRKNKIWDRYGSQME